MAGSAVNYGLGNFGVNVDKSDIELAEGELREAQNATQNPNGQIGGIEKRPGLVPITPDMGDAVLGGIGVPFALKVSTINGTTLSNDPGPGGTPGSAPPIGGTPPPGGAGGSGTVPTDGAGSGSTGVPSIVSLWYRRETTDGLTGASGLGHGYYSSSDRFTTPSGQTAEVLPANPAYYPINVRTKNFAIDAVNFSPGENFLTSTYEPLQCGAPSSVAVLNNKLYYSQETKGSPITNYVQGSLWVNDFATAHRNVATLASEDASSNTCILSILAANGQIYYTVAYGALGDKGAVYYYDPTSGAYGKLGPNFTTETPYALAWHSGQLWMGTLHKGSGSPGTPGNIYRITPPGPTPPPTAPTWTLDHAMSSGTGVLSICSYQGQLYAGSLTFSSQDALIEVRSTLGAWTTSDTISTGVARYAFGLIVFGSNLYYASSTIGNAALLRKFNGSAWSTAASPSVLMTISWIVESTLMFGGGGDAFGVGLFSTPDGTTWTDRTANLSNNTGLALAGGGVAVVQAY